jgi:hypothetical protein
MVWEEGSVVALARRHARRRRRLAGIDDGGRGRRGMA